ncbi:TonB-dependent receptor [Sphingomonas sp.]|uniref:TonB-dependent receptor n=1 Tax=Sphingomonas sp. TaxID=28214 RepID=UPI001B2A289A|nr:TonB-dependent receptor [Sphingomonas sp.]MBO9711751.1 TonB-dependent receptor [Sphingomonas sp.]
MKSHWTPLAGGLSLVALVAAAPCFAQTNETPTAVAGDDSAGGSGDDIIVTARKRAETLQDVPLAVTALSDTDLQTRDIQDVNGLYGEVPGLFSAPGSVNNSADAAYLTMRGVGFNAGLEPAVGVFLDGMYIPQLGFDMAFLDLERVEVLRGPQGTLFGRNTQGGAINLVSRRPGEELRGRAELEAAEFGSVRAAGSVSGPVTDGLYAGVSLQHSRTDGYLDNIVLGGHQDWSRQTAVRGVLRWLPAEGIEVMLVGDYTNRNYNEAIRGVRLATHRYESVVDQDAPDNKSNHGVQLNVSAELGGGITLTSITGYRYSSADVFTDMDSRISVQQTATLPAFPPVSTTPQTFKGATLDVQTRQKFKSQELRLNGSAGPVDWLVGGYYFSQDQDFDRYRRVGPGTVPFPAALYIYENHIDDRDGYAAFGQASWQVTDKVELTAGGRWSHEAVVGTGDRGQVFGPPLNVKQPVHRDARAKYSNFSWMASASYKLTPGVLAYATYAEGWKAGGINRSGSAAANSPYADESSQNYELGLKAATRDQALTFNLALYRIEIRNQQVTNVIPDPGGGPTPVSVVENAAGSHVTGLEAELSIRPVEGLRLRGALSYSRSRFDSFVRVFTPTDKTDFSGTPFENVPETTAFAAADYHLPLVGERGLDFHAEYRFVDSIIIQDNTRASKSGDQLTAPSYDRVNASISFDAGHGVRLTAFVNNLFDTFDATFPSSDPLVGGDVFVVPLPPRQFGVRAAVSF